MLNWNDILTKQNAPSEERKKTQYTNLTPVKGQPKEITVRILDEQPKGRHFHWLTCNTPQGFKGRSITCNGKECPACKAGEKAQTKYGVNVYNYDTKQVEILERGIEFFRQVAGLAKAYKGATKTDLQITAMKGAQKMTYTIIPMPPEEFDNSLISEEDLYDIEKLWEPIGSEKIQQLINGVNIDDVFAKKDDNQTQPTQPQVINAPPVNNPVEGFEAIDDSDLPF